MIETKELVETFLEQKALSERALEQFGDLNNHFANMGVSIDHLTAWVTMYANTNYQHHREALARGDDPELDYIVFTTAVAVRAFVVGLMLGRKDNAHG